VANCCTATRNTCIVLFSYSGPEGTCFEGGVFPAKLIFPPDYPLSPPKMQFTCEMFHPNSRYFVRFEVFTAVDIQVGVFWVVMPSTDVVLYQCFGGLCYLHLWVTLKMKAATLHGNIAQKTLTWK